MKTNQFPTPEKRLSALQSIKFYCRWICCCNDFESWRNCSVEKCVLWRYRLGIGNKVTKKKTATQTAVSTPKKLKIKQSGGDSNEM